MMRALNFISACLLVSAHAVYAADTSAGAVAETMQQAKYSSGFEARLNVFVTLANGAHPEPFKIAVIGQMSADKQRLLVRGIAPEAVRGRHVAAGRGSDGRIKAVAYRAADEYAAADPNARLFNSGLVAWDMFGSWWYWPQQTLGGTDQINGRECRKIRSATDDASSSVREVESCVDLAAKLSLRTRLYDSRHALLRTTTVAAVMRNGDGGRLIAKKLQITEANRTRTEVEVYTGDDQYEISAETFAALDHLIWDEQQGTR
jgi:hypothetical protein